MTYPKGRGWDGDFPPLEHAVWLADAPSSNSQYQLMEGINGYGDQASVLFPVPAPAPSGLRITSKRSEVLPERSNRLQLQYRIRGNSVNATQRGPVLRIDAPAGGQMLDDIKTAVDNLSGTPYVTAYENAAAQSVVADAAFAPVNFSGGTPDRLSVCEVNSEGPVFIVRGTEQPANDTGALLAIRGGGTRFTIAPGDSVWARSGNTGQQHYSARCWRHEA